MIQMSYWNYENTIYDLRIHNIKHLLPLEQASCSVHTCKFDLTTLAITINRDSNIKNTEITNL